MPSKIHKQLKARRAAGRRASKSTTGGAVQTAASHQPTPLPCAPALKPVDAAQQRKDAMCRATEIWQAACGNHDRTATPSPATNQPPKRVRSGRSPAGPTPGPTPPASTGISIGECLPSAVECVGTDGAATAGVANGVRVLNKPREVQAVRRLLGRAQDAARGGEGKNNKTVGIASGGSNIVFNAPFLSGECLSRSMGTPSKTPWDQAVVRITRPGSERDLEDVVGEMVHLIHAACSGYGLECIAVMPYRAQRDSELWGMMVVYPKAIDLNDGLSMIAGNVRKATFLFNAAGEAIRSQARAGGLQIDAKPANYLCTSDCRTWAIDFDPEMFSVVENESPQALMLISMSFFAAHIRAYHEKEIADEFALLVAPLFRHLLSYVDASHWCMTTRARCRDFDVHWCYQPDNISRRMQSVATAYFTKAPATNRVSTMRMDESTKSDSLLTHLIEFSLSKPLSVC